MTHTFPYILAVAEWGLLLPPAPMKLGTHCWSTTRPIKIYRILYVLSKIYNFFSVSANIKTVFIKPSSLKSL